MANECVLLTGGAGFVGSHTVIEFVNAGYSVVILDNLANASMESIRRVEEITGKKIPTVSADLLNKKALEELFSKHKFTSVVHFAGLKAVGESCEVPLLYYRTNVGGTINLLEVMKSFGVKNLIFSSSCTVYGTIQYLPVDEKHPVGSCTNPYGKTKYFIEEILKDLSKAEPILVFGIMELTDFNPPVEEDWNIVILRYFNPVGAHESGKIGEDPQGKQVNLMPFAAQVIVGRQKALKIFGNDYDTPDGTAVRDYIHVVDIAKGHVAAQKKVESKCGCKVYNLGSGKGYSVLEMTKALEKASGKPVAYNICPRRAGDIGAVYSNADLAKKELGWTATKDLDEICADLWRWQSMNPNGYRGNS